MVVTARPAGRFRLFGGSIGALLGVAHNVALPLAVGLLAVAGIALAVAALRR